jgi:hypothetical protein
VWPGIFGAGGRAATGRVDVTDYGLVVCQWLSHLRILMKHWSSRRIVALVLGVFLALEMSLSAVQASEMAVQMAMASDAGASGQGDCDGCGSDDDAANAVACSSVLNCSSVALLPVECGLAVIKPAKLFIPISGVARDLTAPPDPYPPKSLDLG